MASHLSTPPSVLAAPAPTRTIVSAQHGITRAERRHGLVTPRKVSGAVMDDYLLDVRMAGQNAPHVGSPRRGRNVLRNRAVAS